MPEIQRPSGVNVGVNNPGSTLYVRGNETKNLSMRFNETSSTSVVARFESMENDVWNLGTMSFGSASIRLGEATLSSAFAYLEMKAPGELAALSPHIEFDNDGTKLVHTPVLGALTEFDVATVPAGEESGTVIDQGIVPNFSNLVETITHKVGATGATAQVTYTVYEGTDNTGAIKDQLNLPASEFSADAFVDIPFNRSFGVEAGESIFIEMTSAVSFSMATDAGGNLITIIEASELAELGIVTENMMLDGDLNPMLDGDLNPMYGSQF